MNQEPFVHAYWKARKETHRACVARTLKFLEALSEEPGLNKWFKGGRTKKEASRPQELSMEAIGKRMKPVWKPSRGIPAPNSTDRLGFSFSAWNGNEDAGAGVLIFSGLYDPEQKNSVRLRLPKQLFPGDGASKEKFERLLGIAVRTWDPDIAVVTTSERKDLAFGDRDTPLSEKEWEKCMTNSAWLLYRRGQSLVANPTA
jgi:hypothetical protein